MPNQSLPEVAKKKRFISAAAVVLPALMLQTSGSMLFLSITAIPPLCRHNSNTLISQANGSDPIQNFKLLFISSRFERSMLLVNYCLVAKML